MGGIIKNSLWNIGGRAQVLLENTDENDESYKLLKTIKRRSDEANRKVRDLLDFAKRGDTKGERKKLN